MTKSRRDFLKDTACGLSAAALVSSLDRLNVVNAMVQQQPEVASDYRALVCIFLFGGNDCNNTIIPLDSEYDSYFNVRNNSGLAIPRASLLPLPNSSGGGGRPFGMHPNLSPEVANPALAKGLLDVWNAQKLAVQFNVGNLVQPLTRAQYLAGQAKPYQLFSHSDQTTQQQTVVSNSVGQTGWGGRVADLTGALNGTVALPMNISLAGTSLFATGITSRQLAISSTGHKQSQPALRRSLFGGIR
ncbi:MAG: twin-arginine translocation signal domain-containing protein [Acidobacteria bacterium]|nr:twin-arginine translocation signal domain-containing protein [Acidobacteriota bacterium]